jgi:hypothetical protein
MMTADTLLFDGTDLQSLTGVVVGDLSGLFAPGTRRGDHDTIPGRPGQLGAELPYDAYSFSIPITVLGDTRFEMLTRLRAVGAALAGTGGLGVLERRLDDGAGGYDAHTANGQFASFNTFSLLNPKTGQTELTFVNLDGAWFDSGAPTVPIVP